MKPYENTIPPLTQQKGKILVLHNADAPAAKKQEKTWIHFIRDESGRVLKGYSPPSPPPGSGSHTYRYVLVDSTKAGSFTQNNIQNIPIGEEIKRFIVEQKGGKRRKTRKIRKCKRYYKRLSKRKF